MGSIKEEMRSPAEDLLEAELADDSSSPSSFCAPHGDCRSGCDITITPAPEEPSEGPELDSACVEDVTQVISGPAAEQPEVGPPDPADTMEAEEPGSPLAPLEQIPESDASHTDRDGQKETFYCTTKKQRSQERDTVAEREKELGGSSGESQVPGSPARLQHIQTQVSLEVVQCHSVATSPMTPPEGAGAFHFLYSSTKLGAVAMETGGDEMQRGRKVEYRSVATAPMTPRTPTAHSFPEISEREKVQMEEGKAEEGAKENSEGDRNKEEMEVKRRGLEGEKKEKADEGSEKVEEERITMLTKEKNHCIEDGTEARTVEKEKVNETSVEKEGEKEGEKDGKREREPGGEQDKSEKPAEQKSEENSEELVQEVCWDEKGMTWEVYGAVVEVAVLGSAIQKHLEKQVKKHKKQPSSGLPPPPPLSPSATPLPSTPPPAGGPGQGGRERKSRAGRRGEREGKRARQRRNPFRLLLQPHCCSRGHAAE